MVGDLADLPYTRAGDPIETVSSYRRVHANSEQTHVVIAAISDQSYVAFAYDIDPRDYDAVAGELIGYEPTLDGAQTRAQQWMHQHPRGIGADEDGGGGIGAKLFGFLKQLDQSATPAPDPSNSHSDDAPGPDPKNDQ